MYGRVILADDGSTLARSAIPRTAALAAACESEVLVVRVSHDAGVRPQDLDKDEWRRYVSPEGLADSVIAPLEAEPHLSEVVAALQAQGVERVGSVVLHGDPADALVEAADALEADLLVVSSRGETGIRRAVLGSVAEQLVREARGTAILLSPASETADARLRRVMVTLDGSEIARIALPHAEYLARALGAELVLFQVTESEADLMAASMPVGVPPEPSISIDTAQRVAGEQRANVEAELGEHEAILRAHGVENVVVEVASAGLASDAILEAAERLDVDLVVMATHGRGGLGRLLLGSVADSVTRDLEHAAVLLVRPDRDD